MDLSAALALLAANHPDAREQLLARAQDRLGRFAHHALRQFPAVAAREQTGDVVQELCLRLHKGWAGVFADGGVPVTDPAVFLRRASRLLREVLLDLKRMHTGRHGDRPNCGPLPDAEPAAPAPVEAQFDVHEAVDALDDDLRSVVDLHFYQDLTHAEVGHVLGLSEVTVRRRWAKARLKLITRLGANPFPADA